VAAIRTNRTESAMRDFMFMFSFSLFPFSLSLLSLFLEWQSQKSLWRERIPRNLLL